MAASPLLTVREVQERLGMKETAVRRLLHDGKIAYHRLGRFIRISEVDLDAYLMRQRTPATAELVGADGSTRRRRRHDPNRSYD